MKTLLIVGARPQFIKAAAIIRAMNGEFPFTLLHTGQHYDQNMSDVFFRELGIPEPDMNLGIHRRSRGAQISAMLAGIETAITRERPDWVLVFGDTNSTLAGALASTACDTRLAHVEAGLRSYNRRMPEEINRVLSDHISDLLFCPSQTAVDNLAKEGIRENVHLVGDLMMDVLLVTREQAFRTSTILENLWILLKKAILSLRSIGLKIQMMLLGWKSCCMRCFRYRNRSFFHCTHAPEKRLMIMDYLRLSGGKRGPA